MGKSNLKESLTKNPTSDSDADQDNWDEELIRAVGLKPGKSEKNPEEIRFDLIQLCLNEGADINVQDAKGNTALHVAVKKDYRRTVKLFRDKGARTDIPDGNGDTAITLAETLRKQDILKILKEPSRAQGEPEVRRSSEANNFASVADEQRPSTSRMSDIDLTQREHNTLKDDSERAAVVKDGHLSGHDHEVEKMLGIVEAKTYSAAATLTRSWPGLVYQLKHLAFTLHCASQHKDPYFFLATEMIAAEKLDDVVLLYKSDSGKQVGRFVQIKYTSNQSGKISAKQLLEADGNFSVLTYFTSWRKVKQNNVFRKIEVRNMILCTNMGLDSDDLKRNGIHCENAGEPDKPFELKSKVKKTAWYKLSTDKKSNKMLYRGLKETSEVRRLAKLMVKCICDKKDMRLEMGSLRDYHLALVRDVFSTKTKEFHHSFIHNEGLSQRVGKFREVFLSEFEKMEKPSKTGISEESIWTKIHKLFQKLNFRQDFGNASKLTAHTFTQNELPDDDIDDTEISHFLEEFTLAVDQPNEDELNGIIRDKIDANSRFNLLNNQLIDSAFQTTMLDWFVKKDEHGKGQEYLSYKVGEKFFNDMNDEIGSLMTIGVNSVYCEQMKAYGVRFKTEMHHVKAFLTEDRSNSTPNRILELVAPKKTLITALRVYDTLERIAKYKKMDSFIFTSMDSLKLPGIRNTVMTTLDSLLNPDLLIIDCGTTGTEQYSQTLWYPLWNIMANHRHKRLIVISQSGQDLGSHFIHSHRIHRENDDDHSFRNLNTESQKNLLDKQVTKFQGQTSETSFGRLLGILDPRNLSAEELEDCSKVINSNTLVELISRDDIHIGSDLEDMGDVTEYYITRTIYRHVIIKNDILKNPLRSDLFAISSRDRELSDEFVKMGKTSSLNRNFEYLTILESGREEEQFKNLCAKNAKRNVHWLKMESEKYIWKQSQGDITNLVKYRDAFERHDDEGGSGATYLSENQLAAHNQPLIISDTAGMGKSTLLTDIAWKIKAKNPNMLVLQIDLNGNTKALSEVTKTSSYDLRNVKGAIQFLVNELLSHETDFGKWVFKTIIEKKCNVALMFDGFDEISPTYENIVVDLLETLVDYGITRLFVATRPHTKKSLEMKLNAFSYGIKPLSANNQEDFLIKYWKNRYGFAPADSEDEIEDRIEIYAKAMMKKLAGSIRDQRKKFTGIPLQTRLVAEIFENHCQVKLGNFDSCKEFVASENIEPKFPGKINLIYLYEHFVDKKFDIVFNKTGSIFTTETAKEFGKSGYNNFIDAHMRLALNALFDEDKVRKLLPHRGDMSDGLLELINRDIVEERTGIITQIIDGRAHFGHQTYAEYFAAKFISDELKKCGHNESLRDFVVGDILLGENYGNIRAFMDFLLSDEHNRSLMDKSWKVHFTKHRSKLNETIFHVAAREGNDKLIIMFLNCLGAKPRDRKDLINVKDKFARTAVHRAAEYGHFNAIQLLVENTYFKINSQDIEGETPLHLAVYSSKFEVVKYLVEKGANVNAKENDGWTPLHSASFEDQLDIVKYLLYEGANVNARDHAGRTPLYISVQRGQRDVAKYLLDKGADINTENENGWTPLYIAANKGQWDLVHYMLKKGANANAQENYGWTPLHLAATQDQLDVVKYLLKKGANVNAQANNHGWTPLHLAVRENQLDVVKYLLDWGANVDAPENNGSTTLYIAAVGGQWDVARHLLDRGADINFHTINGWTPLHMAVRENQLDIVKYLLDQGADVNARDDYSWTPLYIAAFKGQWDVVQYMLKKGANVNAKDNHGWTLLHLAARENQLDVVKYLLDEGANVNAQDNSGWTPLHIAASTGQLDVVQCMLTKGANVNVHSEDRWTPLHSAAQQGQLDSLKYLLDKGADVESEDRKCRTPLYIAAQHGRLDIVKYLLYRGANVNSQDNHGKTPLDAAAFADKSDVVEYLRIARSPVHSRWCCNFF